VRPGNAGGSGDVLHVSSTECRSRVAPSSASLNAGWGTPPRSESRSMFSILNIEQIVFIPVNDHQHHDFSELRIARLFEVFLEG
jgi:hypothetical protein